MLYFRKVWAQPGVYVESKLFTKLLLLLHSPVDVHYQLVVSLFAKFYPMVLSLVASVLWPGALLWYVLLLWLIPMTKPWVQQ